MGCSTVSVGVGHPGSSRDGPVSTRTASEDLAPKTQGESPTRTNLSFVFFGTGLVLLSRQIPTGRRTQPGLPIKKGRCEFVSAPDVADRGLADPLLSAIVRQLQCVIPAGSVCKVDFIDGLSSPARSNILQTIQTFLAETLPPQINRMAVHRKLLRNCNIGFPSSGCHHDPAPQRHLLRRSTLNFDAAPPFIHPISLKTER